jgi:hypothetical protein
MKIGQNAILVLSVSLAIGISSSAQAADQEMTVQNADTAVYSSTDSGAAPTMKLKKGQKVRAEGKSDGGFYKLKTKSGKPLFVRVDDVKANSPAPEDDLETLPAANSHKSAKSAGESSFDRFKFDLGGSSGNSNGRTFFEAHLGVDYYFLSWFYLREAPFYRLPDNHVATYGLDSSINGQLDIPIVPEFAPNLGIGGGYRVTNIGKDAPFLEGGLEAGFKGTSFNASMKYIMNEQVKNGLANERIYTLSASFSKSGSF